MAESSVSNRAIESQLGLYDQLSRNAAPTDVTALRTAVGLGLHLFQVIRSLDARWIQSVQRTGMPPRIDDAQQLGRLYQRWIDTTQCALPTLKEAEDRGQTIVDATAFRDAYLDALSMLSVPLEKVYASLRNVKTSAEVGFPNRIPKRE